MARIPLVAGNWKMNGTGAALAELDGIAAAMAVADGAVEVAICPPFTLIERAVARQPGLVIGGQDCHAAESGPYTGCIAAGMLTEIGARMVIVGHSERRAAQHETDAEVKAKACAAIAAGLVTILCVGESKADRDAGNAERYVEAQLRGSVPQLETDLLVIGYEPLWAVGTGQRASVADVEAMHAVIRQTLERLGGARATATRILYGGSVTGENAAELFALEDVDGALVGGASLTAAGFVPIIEAACPR